MKSVLDIMFPHTMRLYRIVGDTVPKELLVEQPCNVQLKSMTNDTINQDFKLTCPYIDESLFIPERVKLEIEVDVCGKTKGGGQVYSINNTHIYTVNGVKLGCTMDIHFIWSGVS